MLAVPRNGCRKPLKEVRVLGNPSQLAAQLRGVHRAASVVAGTVRDQVVRVLQQPQRMQDLAHDLEIRALAISTDDVALPHRSAREDGPDGGAVVVHVDPVAHVEAGAVHARPPAGERRRDGVRDELLGMLARTVVVDAVGDGGAKNCTTNSCSVQTSLLNAQLRRIVVRLKILVITRRLI